MPAPSKNKPEGVLGLSNNEARLLLLGMAISNEDQPKVDYEKLAVKGGWKSSSAGVMHRNAKKKLLELTTKTSNDASTTSEASSDTTAAMKKTAVKRKNAASAKAEDVSASGDTDGNAGKATESGTADPAAATGVSSNDTAEGDTGEAPKKRQRKAPAKKGTAKKVNKKAQAKSKDADEEDEEADVTTAAEPPKANTDGKSSETAVKQENGRGDGITDANTDSAAPTTAVDAAAEEELITTVPYKFDEADFYLPTESSVERNRGHARRWFLDCLTGLNWFTALWDMDDNLDAGSLGFCPFSISLDFRGIETGSSSS